MSDRESAMAAREARENVKDHVSSSHTTVEPAERAIGVYLATEGRDRRQHKEADVEQRGEK